MARPGIKVMADYQCWPLWHYGGSDIGNIDPRTLGLSAGLQAQFKHWSELFESHLDWSDPASVSWSAGDKAAFEVEGRRLCVALAREIGAQFSVFYFDSRTATCIPVEDLFLQSPNA